MFNMPKDEYGLVVHMAGEPSGNAFLYSAYYLYCILKRFPGEYTILRKVFEAYKEAHLGNGLYARHPVHFRNDQTSPDELTAMGFLVSFGHRTTHQYVDILSIGRNTLWRLRKPFLAAKVFGVLPPLWYYPTEEQYMTKFSFRAFMGRFPATISHLKLAVGERLNFFERLYWSICVATSGMFTKRKHDPWLLSMLMVDTYENTRTTVSKLANDFNAIERHPRSKMMDYACEIFRSRFNKKWDLPKLFEEYFMYRHPICEIAKEKL